MESSSPTFPPMLTIYAKNVHDNIPAHVLRKIAEELDNDD